MNTNNNLLSICCLGYNHGKFIADNIKAIWKSNYKNIEIIVVDDGSKDNSGKILKDLQAKSPFPMKVILQKNTGNVGHNFNIALQQAKGQFITFMSLDDVLNPNTIAKVMDLLKSDKKVAFVASSVIQGIDDSGRLCNNIPSLKLKSISQPTINDLLELEYNEFGAFYIQGAFFRKEIVDAVNGFDEDMTGDDIILRTKVFKFMVQNPEWTFKILSEPLCFYRQHDSNIHSNSLRQMKIVSEYLERYWPDRENPKIFVGWACHALRQIPKERWTDFFGLNKRALSCLSDARIQALFNESETQEKIIFKIPLIITIKRIKKTIPKEKKIILSLLGLKVCLYHKRKKARH